MIDGKGIKGKGGTNKINILNKLMPLMVSYMLKQ